ncbi:ubiquinol-cytochrome C chaperone family protein [Shinella oryzae]|uniref:ubiquinol-cytochrome C chaperone family protein n=1 Tax=Shinella TaxID=323620 RepID=UPI001FF6B7AE|nr:ubiquinol-cytochrome C chaperone family protein [Shinella oryzae]UPA25570.1 ubiquinol-cytochrome C chaperone [Shinella oryzae]
MQHDLRRHHGLNQAKLGFMMIFGLFGKKNGNRRIVEKQYATLTTAARHPYLYEALDVPDTVMGRFEMLSAILILYFRRTRASATSGQEIAQEIVDAFFEDVDHSIRELGVGDAGVPKRMKKFAGMFYGRLESYAAAFDAADRDALAAALRRNIYPEGGEGAPSMNGLAAYLFDAETAMAGVGEDAIAVGALTVLEPRAPAQAV